MWNQVVDGEDAMGCGWRTCCSYRESLLGFSSKGSWKLLGGIDLFFISSGLLSAEGCVKRGCEEWVEEE